MKRARIWAVIAALAALAGLALWTGTRKAQAQSSTPGGGGANLHLFAGIYNAVAYQSWRTTVFNGPYASGSNTLTVSPAFVTLPDGYTFNPFSTNVSIIVGLGTPDQETVTPSAVAQVPCPSGAPNTFQGTCESITATFSNAHGQGDIIATGSAGIQDAFQDAANADGGLVYWQADTGTVTLNTGGLTTTTTTNVPKQWISLGASGRVETTITTSANWAVGITGSTSAFCTADSTLTAGTTCLANMNNPAVVGTTSPYTLTAILFTMGTSNPGAGAIKAKVWGITPVQAAN